MDPSRPPAVLRPHGPRSSARGQSLSWPKVRPTALLAARRVCCGRARESERREGSARAARARQPRRTFCSLRACRALSNEAMGPYRRRRRTRRLLTMAAESRVRRRARRRRRSGRRDGHQLLPPPPSARRGPPPRCRPGRDGLVVRAQRKDRAIMKSLAMCRGEDAGPRRAPGGSSQDDAKKAVTRLAPR